MQIIVDVDDVEGPKIDSYLLSDKFDFDCFPGGLLIGGDGDGWQSVLCLVVA